MKRGSARKLMLMLTLNPQVLISSYVTRARSVYSRSQFCDLDWPIYTSVSEKELSFPVAFVITAFMDIRNLGELTIKFNILSI